MDGEWHLDCTQLLERLTRHSETNAPVLQTQALCQIAYALPPGNQEKLFIQALAFATKFIGVPLKRRNG